MEPVLMSTLLFVPKGHTAVISIRFYLSDHPGLWDTDTNSVYLNEQLWSLWRSFRNDQPSQKKFFDRLVKISSTALK
jgi:hypothetical protein